MCRVLSYLGEPILVADLLYNPDNSLVTQSYRPKLMTHMLNLAGFGFAAWDKNSIQPRDPFIYRTHALPFYDENLNNLCFKINTNCLIAHVRGIAYRENSVVSLQNVHPFRFDNSRIVFAHNGTLMGFSVMRLDILKHVKSEYAQRIRGTTDSETMYALFLSQLKARNEQYQITDIFDALSETLTLLQKIRKKHGITFSSPLNFFISDGNFIVATRFVFDYGHYPSEAYVSTHTAYHSLWYTYGEQYGLYETGYQMKPSKKMKSIIISSEPLTEDSTTWIEVPEYSYIGATIEQNKIMISSIDIL